MTKKSKSEKEEPKIGRPLIPYSKAMAEKICNLIITNSLGLHDICNLHPEIPKTSTIYEWIANRKEFSDMYLDAKQKQIMAHMEETYKIADESKDDYIVGENGLILNSEHIQRSKLRIELRKWQAARLMPRLFGDKVQTESTVTMISHEDALKALDK